MASMQSMFAELLGVNPQEIEKREAARKENSLGESVASGLSEHVSQSQQRLDQLMRYQFQAENPLSPLIPSTPTKGAADIAADREL